MKQAMFFTFSLLFVVVLCLPHTFAQNVPLSQVPIGDDDLVKSVSFSPDGQTLASGHSDGIIRLWDANTLAHLKTLEGHTHNVDSLSFSPDGQTLASGSWDRSLRLWDASTRAHLETLEGVRLFRVKCGK